LIKGQIYLVGSLREPKVIALGNALRDEGFLIFEDWISAGPDADDCLRDYYRARRFNYKQILSSPAAKHIFAFDKYHLDQSEAAILIAPAGKSCHLEIGYMAGQGKKTFYYLEEEPERVDIMTQFCTAVCLGYNDLVETLRAN
jgi:hypothetical protein